MANAMTDLLNKIERRLGLSVLPLPDKLSKDKWVDIIREDTLPTFSRYFPFYTRVIVSHEYEKDGYFFIDRALPPGTKILGVKDVDWEGYGTYPDVMRSGINYGNWDFLAAEYSAADIAMTQCRADYISLFNLGIYIDFYPPNKIKLVSVNGSVVNKYQNFPVIVFIQHPDNLMTISPTMMEIFEQLAQADIATFLYQNLKYYDGGDTVFANIDLKLDTLQDWANKRNDIVEKLDQEHTTTANENQPMMMTI